MSKKETKDVKKNSWTATVVTPEAQKMTEAEKTRMEVLDEYWAKAANQAHILEMVANRLHAYERHIEEKELTRSAVSWGLLLVGIFVGAISIGLAAGTSHYYASKLEAPAVETVEKK